MLIINGYAGVRVYDGFLHFNPMLHEGWKSYAFKINYHGCVLSVKVEQGKTCYNLLEGSSIEIYHCGEKLSITSELKCVSNLER